MVNEEHGATHAYDLNDLERLTKQGWKPESGDSPKPEPAKNRGGRPKKIH